MATPIAKPKSKSAPRRTANGRIARRRSAEIVVNGNIHIPPIKDHAAFLQWAFSDEFPQRGHFGFFAGTLWVDVSMETEAHNQIKTAITIVLGSLVLNESLGRFYADRMLLTNSDVELSTEPDGMFAGRRTLESGRAKLLRGKESLELRGSVDMVLEIVSKTSEEKDTVVLVEQYAGAGIDEYWLVGATTENPELSILHLTHGIYKATRSSSGWVKSRVFGRSFRLTSTQDPGGPEFCLEVK